MFQPVFACPVDGGLFSHTKRTDSDVGDEGEFGCGGGDVSFWTKSDVALRPLDVRQEEWFPRLMAAADRGFVWCDQRGM